MEKYRSKSVAEKYSKTCKENLLIVGDQSSYEWQQDLIAMKWMILRLQEFINEYKNRDDKPTFYSSLEIGYRDLLKRVSEYSCPNMRKEKYKSKSNCPLADKCMCLKQFLK